MIPVAGPFIDVSAEAVVGSCERPGCMRVTLPAGTIVFVNAAPLRVYSACEVEAPIENLDMAGLI